MMGYLRSGVATIGLVLSMASLSGHASSDLPGPSSRSASSPAHYADQPAPVAGDSRSAAASRFVLRLPEADSSVARSPLMTKLHKRAPAAAWLADLVIDETSTGLSLRFEPAEKAVYLRWSVKF